MENLHNFLKFKFDEFGIELEHLKQYSVTDLSDRDNHIIKLKNEGLTNTLIAERLVISEGTVRNRIKKLGI